MHRFAGLAVVAVAALAAHAQSACAQGFPAKPIRMVTQFSAGASGDTVVRTITAPLAEVIGVPVVVDNRAGAGGVLAAEIVKQAPPDGYTLFAGTSSTQIIRLYIAKSTPFDPVRDFTPVTQCIESVTTIIVNPALPASTLKELIEYARRNPGKIAYGTSGIGSEHHLSGEQIKQLAGIDMLHVPYKASMQGLLDVVSGRLPMAFAIYVVALPHIKSGKVRALAVVRDRRNALLPDVPAVPEMVPGFEPPPSWIGIFGPAGLPGPLLKRLNADLVKTLNLAETRAKLADQGLDVIGSSPEEFAARIERQKQLVARIVKSAGIQPE
jgi:tripartite-type tricarboxylate transporter receptor subunit TctC